MTPRGGALPDRATCLPTPGSRWRRGLDRLWRACGGGAWPTRGRLDYPHAEIWLQQGSWIEAQVRRYSCAKEPETIAWIEAMAPGAVFYDVGANVGAYTLVAAVGHQGRVHVIAWEPAVMNYQACWENLALNPFTEAVTLLPLALSDRWGLQSFAYASVERGAALHGWDPAAAAVRRLRTLTVPLDQAIARWGLPAPTHLKLDVDGHEWQVLKGARATLGQLQSLLLELPHADRARCTPLVEAAGLRVQGRWLSAPGIDNVVYAR